MYPKILTFLLLLLFVTPVSRSGKKTYRETYFENGFKKEEGWWQQQKKTGYWKYYYPNGLKKQEGHYVRHVKENYWYFYRPDGNLESEGHYKKGKENGWWVFYEQNKVAVKYQFKDGVIHGYSLVYKKGKLHKAEKYNNGKKIGEWTDYTSFKRENKLSDLR